MKHIIEIKIKFANVSNHLEVSRSWRKRKMEMIKQVIRSRKFRSNPRSGHKMRHPTELQEKCQLLVTVISKAIVRMEVVRQIWYRLLDSLTTLKKIIEDL